MSDEELTKLCGDAMGYQSCLREDGTYGVDWKPLVDDAQAMALVKRFKPPMVWGCHSVNGDTWYVGDGETNAEHADLNRAVVEYVAKEHMRSTPQRGGIE